MQILKEHKINIRGAQGTIPDPIEIEVLDNTIVYKGLDISCGCTNVEVTPKKYIVSIKQLHDVKWSVKDPKTQFKYIKQVNFSIIHLDDSLETVTINIEVYDPTRI